MRGKLLSSVARSAFAAVLSGVAGGALVSCGVLAADLAVKAPPAPYEISPWSFETGVRYWFSSGKYKKDLYGTDGTQVSRLTYDNLTGHSAESFWRVDHASGLFLKGYAGLGSITGGHMNDEDFPPGISPYSNTLQEQKHGSLEYASVDLGYNFWKSPTWQLGGFVGYHYWNERLNTFGCAQQAGNTNICPNIPPAIGPIPTSVNTLDNSATWNSLRVGLSGEWMVAPGWKVSADAAYVHGWLSANDFHNLRPDIRGLPEDAQGNGFQIDALVHYQITDAFTVGLGGRWWHIQGDGSSHFEQVLPGAFAQPIKIEQDRFGLLAQASYKFGETPIAAGAGYGKAPYYKAVIPAFHWSGLYAGVNIGYGANRDDVNINPESGEAGLATALGDSPTGLNVRDRGFLGGGQIGYNWQTGRLVWGVESDFDWAQISGSTANTFGGAVFTTTVDKNLSWLGTTRGRVGTLATDSLLLYLTGGVAYGGAELAFDQRQPGLNCPFNDVCSTGSVSKTKVGWTVGAGYEYAVTNRVTLKAEYLYVDLGNVSLTSADTGGLAVVGLPLNYGVNTKFTDNIVRFGLNYKLY
jgi:opacity protein-like surface antigen